MGTEACCNAQAAPREPVKRVAAVEGYRLWAPVYDCMQNPLLSVESRTLRRLLYRIRVQRVVDVACGTGRWMLHFQERGALVFGVDACQEMLAQARQHPELRGRVILGDAQNIPLANEAADLVVCSFAASYIPDLRKLVREMARITAVSGRVVISDMHESAVAAGWSRSFKIGAAVYDIEHFSYSLDAMRSTAEEMGLRLEAEAEAHFEEHERSIFNRAGKQHLYSQLRGLPAIWAGIWIKPCF